jgi:D-isomer specific 2-hydroxyacid dehydrogenase, catalytic domain
MVCDHLSPCIIPVAVAPLTGGGASHLMTLEGGLVTTDSKETSQHANLAEDTESEMTTHRPHILVADPIASEGMELLHRFATVDARHGLSAADLIAAIPAYDALVVRSETRVTADVIAAAAHLRVIARAGVGVDNIDVDAATRRGIIVINSPSIPSRCCSHWPAISPPPARRCARDAGSALNSSALRCVARR